MLPSANFGTTKNTNIIIIIRFWRGRVEKRVRKKKKKNENQKAFRFSKRVRLAITVIFIYTGRIRLLIRVTIIAKLFFSPINTPKSQKIHPTLFTRNGHFPRAEVGGRGDGRKYPQPPRPRHKYDVPVTTGIHSEIIY